MRHARSALGLLLGLGFMTFPIAAAPQPAPPGPPVPPSAASQPPAGQPATPAGETRRLAVRKVVLYKSGVGYFEHLGRVVGNRTVSIDLTSGQLDDVLKSLTTVDLGNGRVTGVTFASALPVEQRLRALALPLGQTASKDTLLNALRGARVEVRAGGTAITGRIVSVEPRTRAASDAVETITHLTVLSAAGEVRGFDLTPGVGVRMLEGDVRGELGQYLDIVGSSRAHDVRRLDIATMGQGARDLFVSYVSEVPVWKTTYRLVIPPANKGKPFLQGWAVVDNTLGEDWSNVQLSLVSGAPQSFVQRLSQPLFTRRPTVPLPSGVLLSPQTHDATISEGTGELAGRVMDRQGGALAGVVVTVTAAGREVARLVSDADGTFTASNLPAGQAVVRAELRGFTQEQTTVAIPAGGRGRANLTLQAGSLAEGVSVARPALEFRGASRNAPGPGGTVGGGTPSGTIGGLVGGLPAPPPAAVADRMRQVEAAEGARLGELFEYALKEPVTIRRNQSALVPIVQAEVEVERVTLWSGSSRTPLRAVWLTNSTPLTLDGGSLTLIENQAFGGDGLLDAIRPAEKRLVSYAADTAARVAVSREGGPQRVSRLRIAHGLFIRTTEERARTLYTLRNEDEASRTFVIEHALRDGWRLVDARPAETTASVARFRAELAAHSTSTLTVDEVRPVDSQMAVGSLEESDVALVLRARSVDPATEPRLRAVVQQARELTALAAAQNASQEAIARIGADQERVRENLKALKGTGPERALAQRYTRQLGEQEDRLATLRRQVEDAAARQAALDKAFADAIAALSLDVQIP